MPSPRRSSAAAGAGAGVVAAGGAAVVTGAGEAGSAAAGAAAGAGVGVAAATIIATFVQFLAALREQHRAWLSRELARYSRQPNDIRDVVQAEMGLEDAFARNAADRLAGGLPQALRISDPREREAKVRELLAREERYAGLRAEAMAARAIAAVTRSDLRQSSPMGAFWRLGVARQHTEGCLFMAGKFWPWAVLDGIHPPRHYGCTSSLHGYGEAILNGWMTPSDVPDTREAVRSAAGVVMEGDEAEALLRELDVRDRLLEQGVSESVLSVIAFKGAG